MTKRTPLYILINGLILAFALYLFLKHDDHETIFAQQTYWEIGLFLVTALVVQFIKALRLYVALYGATFSIRSYIKTYCKVTPVCLLFPYKLGEFFRIYCYGELIHDFLRGTVIVILDRFMDTSALLTLLLGFYFFSAGQFPPLVLLLAVVWGLILLGYYLFPGFYRFRRYYYLSVPASAHTLWILRQFARMNLVYQEAAQVAHGRGMLLYILSLMAWGIELLNLALVTKMPSAIRLQQQITNYMSAALTNGNSLPLQRFITASIILLLGMYIVLKLSGILQHKKGKNHENNHCI